MYTTHGLMTGADYTEYLKDTDQGSTIVDADDPPEWFDAPVACPICDSAPEVHDTYTVQDASGEIIECSEGEQA